LMSAIEMLEQYGLAPLCGELTQGGFSTAMADGKSPIFIRRTMVRAHNYCTMIIVSSMQQVCCKTETLNKLML